MTDGREGGTDVGREGEVAEGLSKSIEVRRSELFRGQEGEQGVELGPRDFGFAGDDGRFGSGGQEGGAKTGGGSFALFESYDQVGG